jgi:hypothetical protein
MREQLVEIGVGDDDVPRHDGQLARRHLVAGIVQPVAFLKVDFLRPIGAPPRSCAWRTALVAAMFSATEMAASLPDWTMMP